MSVELPPILPVRPAPPQAPPRAWPSLPARVISELGPDRRWQVLGAAGTGKTSLVVDAAVARIAAGSDPESVLVLAQSATAAAELRRRITVALLSSGSALRATREPLVRTVHSFAFAIVRLQAAAHGNRPPRLLTGAEQDSVIRELLRGESADGGGRWPEHLQPALTTSGFAGELRSLILRAAERGLGPEDLVRWGRRHRRPEWVAAGGFAAQYEQAMMLRGSVGVEAPEATAAGLDAAELVGEALTAFATDPGLLAAQRARVRHVLVDDAQHLDPQAARLISLIIGSASTAVVAGDPDQAVFGFRGADPRFLSAFNSTADATRVVLDIDHRHTAPIAEIVRVIASRLPGSSSTRGPVEVPVATTDTATTDTATTDTAAPVEVFVATTPAKEAARIADIFRRAHLIDGIRYARMAVIVRSVSASHAPIRRALAAVGVPVASAVTEHPFTAQRAATAFLMILRAASEADQFTGEDSVALLEGPIGGADPLALRRVRRGLRRGDIDAGRDRESTELIRLALLDHGDASVAALLAQLSDVEAQPLRRVHRVLERTRKVLKVSPRAVEDALWAAWQASGLERRWVGHSARGGSWGASADRDLDSVVALFDAAASYVDRLPRASVPGFVEYVLDQEIPTETRSRTTVPRDAVMVLSAHSAAGREWDVVAVAAVQDGMWPGLRSRGSLLGEQDLIDLAAGVTAGDDAAASVLSRTAPLLADERRLFLSACSRARHQLSVSAVDSTVDSDLVHSRFVDELLAYQGIEADADAQPRADSVLRSHHRAHILALPSLVGELRSVVCDARAAERDQDRHARAVRVLADLAREGVPGAHPDQWYAASGVSTETPLWEGDRPVPLSPSQVERLSTCPLRWALERFGGSDADKVHAVTGSMVHTLAQAVAGEVDPVEVRRALENAWAAVDLGSDWFSRREMERTSAMLEAVRAWLRSTRAELTEIGVEVTVDGVLEPRSPDEPFVQLRGRIDRLERDNQGRAVVVDLKTSKTPLAKDAASAHPQMATYQVALAAGLVADAPTAEPGGARLVYVAATGASGTPAERVQPPLAPEAVEDWRDTIVKAARATQGPTFEAVINNGCRHCPVMSSCPAQGAGRQVTEG